MGDSDLDHQILRMQFEYAWGWFSLHAAQRMSLVNFWLIAMAFLTAAMVTALTNQQPVAAAAVAAGGAVATFCFQMLERRVRYLLRVGEQALERLEAQLKVDDDAPVTIMAAAHFKPHVMLSYRRAIEILHWSAFMAFLVVAALAWRSR